MENSIKVTVNAYLQNERIELFYGGDFDGIDMSYYRTPEINTYVRNQVSKILDSEKWYDPNHHRIEVELEVTMEMMLDILLQHERRIHNLQRYKEDAE